MITLRKVLALPRSFYINLKLFGLGGGKASHAYFKQL